jgi:hypothetical protein
LLEVRLAGVGEGVGMVKVWPPLSAISYRLSAIGYRLSAISYRLSAISYRHLIPNFKRLISPHQ